MINAIFLVAICFHLSVESLKRLVIPDTIDHPMPVLIVGIISLFINTIGLVLFRCSKCRCERQESKTDETFISYPKFTSDVRMDTGVEECPNLREFFSLILFAILDYDPRLHGYMVVISTGLESLHYSFVL